MEVVISQNYGSFEFSDEAIRLGAKLTNNDNWLEMVKDRSDRTLVEVVKRLGKKATKGDYSSLKIVTIPDDVKWEIKDYDGAEWVAEIHRTWH
jgi:hypothetical protein